MAGIDGGLGVAALDQFQDTYKEIAGTRIHYVEPNYTKSIEMKGPHGSHAYEFANDLEDYSIFVNLTAEIKGRTVTITHSDDNDKSYSITYVTNTNGDERISFMQGSPLKSNNNGTIQSLTTNYTDIFIDDILKRDDNKSGIGEFSGNTQNSELFGISSIDINYSSWMVPEVTIQFVDVRGAALFSQEEFAHGNVSNGMNGSVDLSVAGSFFKTFFSFPYPKYTLVVKGFYGYPVSYELTCSDFKATFDSNTGNFNVTAKFVGYEYSFLGDIMLNGCIAAPYSDYIGKEYWEQKVKDGTFSVKDFNDKIVPMQTMGEVIKNLHEVMESASAKIESSDAVMQKEILDSNSELLQGVSAAYDAFTASIEKSINGIYGKVKTDAESGPEGIYATKDALGGIIGKVIADANIGNLMQTFKEGNNIYSMLILSPKSDKTLMDTIKEGVGEAAAKDIKDSYDALKKQVELYNNGSGGETTSETESDNDNNNSESTGEASEKAENIVKENSESKVVKDEKEKEAKNIFDIKSYSTNTSYGDKITLPVDEVKGEKDSGTPEKKATPLKIVLFDLDKVLSSKPIQVYQNANGSKNQYALASGTFNSDFKDYISRCPEAETWLKEVVNKANEISKKNNSLNTCETYKYAYVFDDGGFCKSFLSTQSNNSSAIRENEAEISRVTNQAISEALKFKPTVENVTRMIMAHFQTLAWMIYKTAEDIGDKRAIEQLKVDGVNLKDLPGESKYVPPFPLLTKLKEIKGNTGGGGDDEEYWCGNTGGDWLEEDFVNGILNGINEMSKIISEAKAGEYESEKNGEVTCVMKTPLSPLDMILTSSPYGSQIDFSNISDVMGRIALRMITLLGMPLGEASFDEEKMGMVEASNFATFFKTPTKEFLDKLNAEGFDESKLANLALFISSDFTTQSEIKSYKEGLNNTWAWDSKASKGAGFMRIAKSLIGTDYVLSIYGKEEGEEEPFYVPIQGGTFKEINAELKAQTGTYNPPDDFTNYLPTKDTKKKVTNIVVIENNYLRFKQIAQQFMTSEIENSEVGTMQKKMVELCDFNAENYVDYFKNKDCIQSPLFEEPEFKEGNKVFSTERVTLSTVENKDMFPSGFFGGGIDTETSEFKGAGDKELERGEPKDEDYANPNNLMITFIPAIDDDGEPNDKCSLFAQKGYYKLSSNLYRAYMFLYSMGYFIDYNKIISKLLKDSKVCVIVPRIGVLMIGATLWMNSNAHNEYLWEEGYKPDINKIDHSDLDELREDIQADFIEQFKKFATSEYPSGIEKHFAISFASNDDDFFDNIDTDSKKAYKFFLDYVQGGDFFRNYLSFCDNGYSDKSDFYRGIVLLNRDSGEGMKALRNVLTPCALLKTTKYYKKDSDRELRVSGVRARNFLHGFFKELKNQYKSISASTEPEKVDNVQRAADCQTDEDIKIAVYRYAKIIYDKWLSGEHDFDKEYGMEKLFGPFTEGENAASYGDDRFFYFIDAYYNRIGQRIIVNIGNVVNNIIDNFSTTDNQQFSLLSFLSLMYSKNKFSLLPVQNFIDISKPDALKSMFKPIPFVDITNDMVDSTPNFIVMYPYETSVHLSGINGFQDDSFLINPDLDAYYENSSNTNLDGETPSYGTGPDITVTTENNVTTASGSTTSDLGNYTGKMNWPQPLLTSDSVGYYIPAFSVAYGKQYQSYFTNFSVGMDESMVTEQAIIAQFQIASMNFINGHAQGGNSGERRIVTMGQDLFTVYSNNSYTCSVTMMGCAFVQPLMMFSLLNVPLFRGTYLIEKVVHNIKPGNMTTTFTGVRLAKTCTKKKEGWFWAANASSDYANDLLNRQHAAANYDNDCPYPVYTPGGGVGGALTEAEINAPFSSLFTGKSEKYLKDVKAKNNDLLTMTVGDAIATMAAVEAGGPNFFPGTKGLAQQIIVACCINRYHNGKKKGDFYDLLQYKQIGSGNADCTLKKAEQFEYRKWAEPVLKNGPAYLVGKVAKACNSSWLCRKWDYGKGPTNGEMEHTITTEDMQTLFCYCTGAGYDSEVAARHQQDSKENPKIWHDAHYLFQEGSMVYTTASEGATKYWEPESTQPAHAEGGTSDNKKKKFWNDLISSVHQSSQNSAVKVDFGEKDVNYETLTGTLTPNTNNADLTGIFDILINGYKEYVESIEWVLGNNPKEGGPSAIKLKATDKKVPKITIKATQNGSPYNSKEISENFFKVMSKYKFKGGGALSEITAPTLTEADLEKYKPKSCDEIVSPGGGSYGNDVGGIGGKLMPSMMIHNWDAGKAANFLITHGLSKSEGLCAFAVQQAVIAGGIGCVRGWGMWKTINLLGTGKWFVVSSGSTNSSEFKNFKPSVGDIMGMTRGSIKLGTTEDTCGHVCMYCGDENGWISDFKQNSAYVYRRYGPGTYHIIRYKGGENSVTTKPMLCLNGRCLRK